MFENEKYITRGIENDIPVILQLFLWTLISQMKVKEKDYLQVFELCSDNSSGKPQQKVIHSQEQPKYKKEHTLLGIEFPPINAKIFCIDDISHSTMLLAEEY